MTCPACLPGLRLYFLEIGSSRAFPNIELIISMLLRPSLLPEWTNKGSRGPDSDCWARGPCHADHLTKAQPKKQRLSPEQTIPLFQKTTMRLWRWAEKQSRLTVHLERGWSEARRLCLSPPHTHKHSRSRLDLTLLNLQVGNTGTLKGRGRWVGLFQAPGPLTSCGHLLPLASGYTAADEGFALCLVTQRTPDTPGDGSLSTTRFI